MKEWIQAVGNGGPAARDLTYEEAVAAARAMAEGDSTDAQNAAFLMALRMKGEAGEELRAFVDVFRSHRLPYIEHQHSLNSVSPYEGRHVVPITLAVSLLLASVGFPQVLHGSGKLPPKLGVSLKEIIEGLGVAVDLSVQAWETVFVHHQIGFLWTDRLCPPIGRLRQVREQLGVRTVINTVEKVINPVHSANLIVGVRSRAMMEKLVPICVQSGFQTVYIVQGMEGSEDLPIDEKSPIRIVTPWGDESRMVEPQKFGFAGGPLMPMSGEEQIAALQRLLAGDDTPELRRERDHIVFNAGLRLMWFDKVASYEEGFQLADTLLRRKEADKLLRCWSELSTRLYHQEARLRAN